MEEQAVQLLWQLEELFRQAEMGRPLVGTANGRLVHLTDKRLPRLKCRLARSAGSGPLG